MGWDLEEHIRLLERRRHWLNEGENWMFVIKCMNWAKDL